MSNVLPPTAQKAAWRFHRAHFVLVGSLVLLIGALLAFAALLPGYVLLRFGHTLPNNSKSILISEATKAGSERMEILRAQVFTEQLSFIAASTTSPVEALTAALRARPLGASIQEIQYTRGDIGTIRLQGVTGDRTKVSAFRDALEEDPLFEEVAVPASALAGAEGGRFTITLTGQF